jgi:hypothetical protein
LKKKGAIADEDRFKKLVQLRPRDNMGAWYHLFGTATLSVSTQSAYIIEGLGTVGHMEMEIANAQNRAIIWVEEALISGDIEKDPNEYCIDNYGLALGNFLISKYEKVAADRLPHSSLSECFRLHFSE